MFAKIALTFIINFIVNGLAATPERTCNDCTVYYSCDVSVVLLRMTTPAADAQLKKAFCGFHNKLPMVCCSELTLPIDGVESHPNLRLLPNTCGKKNKIGGGRPARHHELPWMVLLGYETREFPSPPPCRYHNAQASGGSLINERYVLTAAHCLSDSKLIGVRVGELDVDATTACEELDNCQDMMQDLRIEEAIPHPDYRGRPNVRNDIGLLRLRRPVDLSLKNIGVICLPVTREQQNRDLDGHLAMIAGWGFTEQGYISSVLRIVDVSIYTSESCRQLYNRGRSPNAEDETTNKLCAGQKGRGSCDGDSGGPLVVTDPGGAFVQYGVDSYGPTLCGADFPTAYTDVTKYMHWILDTMRP